MYKYGPNYAQTFEGDDTALMGMLDNGGVHYNSAVLSYVAYLLNSIEDSELREGEERLSDEDDLNLWFETLYQATMKTDFTDIGYFLAYSSTITGLSETQRNLVARIIDEYGLLGHYDEVLKKAEEAEHVNYYFTFDCGNTGFLDRYRVGIRNAFSEGDTSANSVMPFEVDASGMNIIKMTNHMNVVPKVFVENKEKNQIVSAIYLNLDFDNYPMTTNFVIHLREVNLKVGQTFIPYENETIVSIEEYLRSEYPEILTEGKFTAYDAEEWFIATKTPSMASGEYNLIHISAFKE